jgi:hypothetical protein
VITSGNERKSLRFAEKIACDADQIFGNVSCVVNSAGCSQASAIRSPSDVNGTMGFRARLSTNGELDQ